MRKLCAFIFLLFIYVFERKATGREIFHLLVHMTAGRGQAETGTQETMVYQASPHRDPWVLNCQLFYFLHKM